MCGGWGSLYCTCPPGEWKHVPYIQNIVYMVVCWSVRFTPYMCVCMSLVQFPSVLFVSAHLFPQHPSHRSRGVVFYLCACQCAMSTLLCIRGRVFPHSTHLCVSLPSSAFSPLFFFCHMFVQIFFFFFFFCFSHLCSCHVPVPVHQWASALSTRSPWPQMSEQAAARQVHCAAGLCFASSHPSTSCSVMLTVIESK